MTASVAAIINMSPVPYKSNLRRPFNVWCSSDGSNS